MTAAPRKDEIEEMFITHSLRAREVAKKFARHIIETSEVFSMSESAHRGLGHEDQAEFFHQLRERGISVGEEIEEVFKDLRGDLDALRGEYESIVKHYTETLEILEKLERLDNF